MSTFPEPTLRPSSARASQHRSLRADTTRGGQLHESGGAARAARRDAIPARPGFWSRLRQAFRFTPAALTPATVPLDLSFGTPSPGSQPTGPARVTGDVDVLRAVSERTRADDLDVPEWLRDRVIDRYREQLVTMSRRTIVRLVRSGYNLGQVPYGYAPAWFRTGLPNQAHARRTVLVAENTPEAHTVQAIFAMRARGMTIRQITRRLTAEPRYPAPHAAAGRSAGWTEYRVRSILANPKYTGWQLWGRTRNGLSVPPTDWVWSHGPRHTALVTMPTYLHVGLGPIPPDWTNHRPARLPWWSQ